VALRLYGLIDSSITRSIRYGWNKDYPGPRVTRLETDVLTVKHLAQYLCNHKVGRKFQRIEVMLGDYDKDNHGDMDLECPIILFACHIQRNGDILIEDNHHTVQDPCWEEYLKVDQTSNIPGFTYPQNLEQWIRDGAEADRILSHLKRWKKRTI
jgi:hypothetical protein